jgi:hypothetical protein
MFLKMKCQAVPHLTIVKFLILSFALCNVKSDQTECTIKDKLEIDESLNKLQQDDPALIEAVRKMLIRPADPGVPYNFSVPEPELMGQFGQVEDLIEILGKQKEGFFIEAGAYDGEEFSNSLYFETNKNWKGLLVEPNPDALAQLLTKNRKAHIFPSCLSTKTTPETVQFDAAGWQNCFGCEIA